MQAPSIVQTNRVSILQGAGQKQSQTSSFFEVKSSTEQNVFRTPKQDPKQEPPPARREEPLRPAVDPENQRHPAQEPGTGRPDQAADSNPKNEGGTQGGPAEETGPARDEPSQPSLGRAITFDPQSYSTPKKDGEAAQPDIFNSVNKKINQVESELEAARNARANFQGPQRPGDPPAQASHPDRVQAAKNEDKPQVSFFLANKLQQKPRPEAEPGDKPALHIVFHNDDKSAPPQPATTQPVSQALPANPQTLEQPQPLFSEANKEKVWFSNTRPKPEQAQPPTPVVAVQKVVPNPITPDPPVPGATKTPEPQAQASREPAAVDKQQETRQEPQVGKAPEKPADGPPAMKPLTKRFNPENLKYLPQPLPEALKSEKRIENAAEYSREFCTILSKVITKAKEFAVLHRHLAESIVTDFKQTSIDVDWFATVCTAEENAAKLRQEYDCFLARIVDRFKASREENLIVAAHLLEEIDIKESVVAGMEGRLDSWQRQLSEAIRSYEQARPELTRKPLCLDPSRRYMTSKQMDTTGMFGESYRSQIRNQLSRFEAGKSAASRSSLQAPRQSHDQAEDSFQPSDASRAPELGGSFINMWRSPCLNSAQAASEHPDVMHMIKIFEGAEHPFLDPFCQALERIVRDEQWKRAPKAEPPKGLSKSKWRALVQHEYSRFLARPQPAPADARPPLAPEALGPGQPPESQTGELALPTAKLVDSPAAAREPPKDSDDAPLQKDWVTDLRIEDFEGSNC